MIGLAPGPQDDVGLVIRDTQWEDTGSRDYLRLYTEGFLPPGTLDVYGGGQRHTRLIGEKLAWFESVTGVTCHRGRLQNLYSFARCFDNDPLWPR